MDNSQATDCLQTVMIEPKMPTQSVKAQVVKEHKAAMTTRKGDSGTGSGMTTQILFISFTYIMEQ